MISIDDIVKVGDIIIINDTVRHHQRRHHHANLCDKVFVSFRSVSLSHSLFLSFDFLFCLFCFVMRTFLLDRSKFESKNSPQWWRRHAVSTTTIINVLLLYDFSSLTLSFTFVVCISLRYCIRVLILLATACYHSLMSSLSYCPCCLLWWCNFSLFFFCLLFLCVCVFLVSCISLLTYTCVFD